MKHLNRKNLQFFLTSFVFIFCIYKIIHLVIITYHPLPWVDEWNTLNPIYAIESEKSVKRVIKTSNLE